MKKFFTLLSFLLGLNTAFCQSINSPIPTSSNSYCLDSLLNISFSTTGNFASNNVFKLQYSVNYYGVYSDFQTISANNTSISARIPSNLATVNSYQIRVVSTNPVTIGSVNSVSFKTVPAGSILSSSAGSNMIEKGTPITLNLALAGGAYYNITLNDSTKLINSYQGPITVYPQQTFFYKIAKLTNGCGNATITDSLKVNVADIGFKITNISSSKLCQGDNFLVFFDSEIPLASTTQLYIEMTNLITLASFSFPISGFVSPLSINLPNGFPTGNYSMKISSVSPTFSSTFPLNANSYSNNITVTAPINVSLTNSTYQVKYGESIGIDFNISQGGGYVNVVLNDTLVSAFLPSSYSSTEPRKFIIIPLQSNTYSISKAFGSECNNTIFAGIATVNMTPNIYIDSLNQNKTKICTGNSITLYFRTNIALNLSDLRVKLSSINTLIVPSSYTANSVTFTVPNVAYNSSGYGIKLVNSATNFEGTNYRFPVNIIPPTSASISNTSPVTLTGANTSSISVTLNFYDNTLITLSDGTEYQATSYYYSPQNFNIPILVSQTSTFSIASVQNSCGLGQVSGSKTFTVNPSSINAIFVKPLKSTTLCAGSVLPVAFATQGVFEANNKFLVEISSNSYGTFTPLQTIEGTSSPLAITLPNTIGSYRLRVSSTLPSVRSAELSFTIGSNQTTASIVQATYSPYAYVNSIYIGNESVNRLEGENYALQSTNNVLNIDEKQPVKFTINFTGIAPFQYTLSDGTQSTTTNSYLNVYVIPKQGTTNYRLTSVSGFCGNGTVSGDFTVKTQALFLKALLPVESYCLGNELKIPYMMNGKIPTGMLLKAKISESNTFTQELTTRLDGNNLLASLPNTLNSRRHFIKIYGETPTQILESTLAGSTNNSNLGFSIDIKSKPSATLTSTNGQNPIYISSAQAVNLRADFVGLPAFSFLLSNNIRYTSASSLYGFSVLPNQDSLTYRIKEVNNQCGYGTSSGAVKIIKRATISSGGIMKVLCPNESFSMSYVSGGLFGTNNVFRFFLTQGTYKQFLTETTIKSGTISLTPPSGLMPGIYSILIESTEGDGAMLTTPVVISAPISATLSGNTNINPNETTYLKVNLNNLTTGMVINYNYTLSNGQTGVISGNPFYILVNPSVPTTYVLSSISGGCGINSTTGSAFVNVNTSSSSTIRTTENFTSICAGSRYSVSYVTSFTNIPNTQYKVQLSDANGENFIDILTTGISSSLIATIPNNLPEGENYRLRVVCDIPNVMSGTNLYPLKLAYPIIASFTSNPPVIEANAIKNIAINFSGTPPWSFQLQVGNKFYNSQTSLNPSNFTINEAPEGNSIKLIAVSNAACGTGTLQNPLSHTFCPINLNVSQPIVSTQNYSASSTVTGRSIITNQANVIYNGGKNIILSAGFKADIGTVFEAKISGCSN